MGPFTLTRSLLWYSSHHWWEVGGRLFATKKKTNKVSMFDETSQTWTSHYPDLLSVRSKPGVVTHLEHVIAAGGGLDDRTLAQDDIEVLNWTRRSQWRRVSFKLPEPMYGFTPIISDDHYIILGYCGADTAPCRSACKIAVDEITKSNHHQQTRAVPTKWYRIINGPITS